MKVSKKSWHYRYYYWLADTWKQEPRDLCSYVWNILFKAVFHLGCLCILAYLLFSLAHNLWLLGPLTALIGVATVVGMFAAILGLVVGLVWGRSKLEERKAVKDSLLGRACVKLEVVE